MVPPYSTLPWYRCKAVAVAHDGAAHAISALRSSRRHRHIRDLAAASQVERRELRARRRHCRYRRVRDLVAASQVSTTSITHLEREFHVAVEGEPLA